MNLNWELLPEAGVVVLIIAARVFDVSLGTLRIALVSRGMRTVAPFIGFVEMLVWLVALGQVVQHLDRPINYLAYATGYALGTWIGLYLDEKTALGYLVVRIIAPRDAKAMVERLREGRFGVTNVAATGLTGRVRLIYSVIRRRDLPRLLDIVNSEHPKAFVSVSDVRLASEGYFAPPAFSYPRLLEMLRKK